MKNLVPVLALFALAGCAYPHSTVVQQTPGARVHLSNAPLGAAVTVDGQIAGYRTEKKLDIMDVQPGRHLIQITSGGRVLMSKEYFFGAGSIVEIGVPQ